MECKNARLLLEFVRPRASELDADGVRALQDHLNDCPECRALAEVESRLDDHLGRAMRDVPLPEGLQTTLMRRLDTQRDALYKRWAWRTLAAAAMLFLVVGLFGYALFGKKPAPNLYAFRTIADEQFQPLKPDNLKEWLHSVAAKDLEAPPFQLSLLVGYGLGEVEGRRVPMLFYLSGAAWARVYILDDRQFDLDALRTQEAPSGVNGVSIGVLPDPSNDHVFYVVLYHGATNPEFFLKPFPGPVARLAALDGQRLSAKF